MSNEQKNSPPPHTPRPHASETDVLPDDVDEAKLTPEDGLYEDLQETFEKLRRDQATRGDLKVLARAFKELRYAFKVFTPYRKDRKVTVFGSARTKPGHPDYEHAVEFGRRMAEAGYYVMTGAGDGIMVAAHEGSGRERAMGVNIMLPFEQSANHVVKGSDLLVNLNYFFTRKLLFVKEVHAVVCYPGGFGTQDEAFETLTLVQTGKRDMMPVVLCEAPEADFRTDDGSVGPHGRGGDYWSAWQNFIDNRLERDGLISPSDRSLYKITTSVDEAVDEILKFYCVYNSMRYVKDRLVLRLHREPSQDFVDGLNDRFADLCVSGRIEKSEVDALEADDEHLQSLARLKFHFNRRDQGRLRQLIDVLNTELCGDHVVREVEAA